MDTVRFRYKLRATRTSATPPVSSIATTSSVVRQSSRTPAEKAREKKLREDPMAEVHGPLFVTCRRCGSQIKLSPKSAYDPFHWAKHRERCLKRPAGVVRQMKEEAQDKRFPASAQFSPSSQTSKASSSKRSVTPPLTPDHSESSITFESHPTDIKEESPIPDFPPQPATAFRIRDPDPAFEEYLYRSRRKLMRELSPMSPESWHDWNWSQLKPAVWVVATYPDNGPESDRGQAASPPEADERGTGPMTGAWMARPEEPTSPFPRPPAVK
ncbi:hypothetical protein JAAARDRAFT_54875 [Jaapia argillacea MUCL 33604]|uniref:Uncharacterized protein n=1 Tax=Jaapia argillacea MUCL 33604 TaxID=933084 RepID=A0A067QFY4_9AGAM|nr:hypothetical protein JAAARDRAFT_54875 [Jaapia argillacea MUCL 33604]